MDARNLMVVEDDSPGGVQRRGLSDVPALPHLPHDLSELYAASKGCGFYIERVRFRRIGDFGVSGGSVAFADEMVSASLTKQWSYQRIDDLVCSSVGECVTPHVFLQRLIRRELHERAQNDLRYREKCVDGRYVPSPDLTCRHEDDHPVD